VNYSTEQLRRRAHLANGGSLANYDRTHYAGGKMSVPFTLTSHTGAVKKMRVQDKQQLLTFIDEMANEMKLGQVICIDAPVAGIHNGWIQGRKVVANA